MQVLRFRRLCGVLVAFAFLLPLVPAAVGSPLMFGGHCGSAPRYGEGECLAISLGFLILAAVGIALTQGAIPLRLRRQTLFKVLGIAIGFIVFSALWAQ